MTGWGAIGTALNIASILLGGTTSKRQIIMTRVKDASEAPQNAKAEDLYEKITIPVTPRTYEVSTGQGNKVVNVEQVGEALVFGLPNARRLSFSSFFPRQLHNYPFVVGDKQEPEYFIEMLTKWKELRKPVRVIITDSTVNLMVGIMDFNYKEQDGSHDVYYTLSFVEYKDLNTPAANNNKQVDDSTGLKERPSPEKQAAKSNSVQCRDIVDKAKKAYGAANKFRRIVESNDLKDLAINEVPKLRRLVIK